MRICLDCSFILQIKPLISWNIPETTLGSIICTYKMPSLLDLSNTSPFTPALKLTMDLLFLILQKFHPQINTKFKRK